VRGPHPELAEVYTRKFYFNEFLRFTLLIISHYMLWPRDNQTPTYGKSEVFDEAVLTLRASDRKNRGRIGPTVRLLNETEPPIGKEKQKPNRKITKMKSSRSVSAQDVPAKKSAKKATVAKTPATPKNNRIIQERTDRVALRAYFIGEQRRSLGIAGDETSDWVQAEQELSLESK
jgi:hypothetical protein